MARFTKKTKIAIVTAALVIGASATAYAYWTNSGAGTGTGTTGTNAAVTALQSSTVTAMYPGGPAQLLSGTFTNPNSGAVTVGAVTATVTTSLPATCLAAWYVISGTDTTAPHVLPAGAGGTWSGLSVTMTNAAVNQDACKNATITIAYTVAAGA